ncbi:MBL fold metallo-hydrolase [Rhodopila sp.]|jgi:L-ascorbate metabolism protein UlaG (beta-lactamase superfamily)|uniref:MBL fold metallo-hydrolase n=1 Tax=Rhodopila sp. TaxID=2480087 RepID=UPI002CB7E809|nr:MBL fold metallo-hydrolase [Rhodopila sp.]HVZ09494.1 MBL fold metallo-hydrolase [Rhodopila sp.]
MRRPLALLLLIGLAGGITDAGTTRARAGCSPIATNQPRLWPATATPAGGTAGDTVRITFLGHASFEIVSPAGVRAVTDYNGRNIPADPPDIATMNHAHSTHYTLTPDPRIAHVLHGWKEGDTIPAFDLTVRDMRVTNLPTNIRTWNGGGTELYGNSIFVFETGGLCIAHLSHLHHLLEPKDLDALGRIDIVMVAVDGEWTMSQQDAASVVEQIQPRIVLPMHYFTRDVLASFLNLMRDKYTIDIRADPELEVSRASLPTQPAVIALPGGY